MPDVNDDMDELFKKAAEHYPLNTNSSDWNEVYKALPSLNPSLNAPLHNIPKKIKSRRLLWLLLLIPFIIVLSKYIFTPAHQSIHKESVAEKINAGLSEQKNPAQKDIVKENEDHKKLKGKLLNSPGIDVASSPNVSKGARLQKTFHPAIIPPVFHKEKIPDNASDKRAGNIDTKNADNSSLDNNSLDNNSNGAINPDVSNNKEDLGKTAVPTQEDEINTALKVSTVNSQIETPANSTVPATGDAKPYHKPRANKTNAGKQHLYVGIIGGPDLSSIKLQKITRTGFTGGIIAGYKLNTRWSIESGLYLDKKYYYTDGEYFSTKKIPLPSNITIENADGYCNMIEVPLNLKYNFKPNQNGNWFAIGGISSYFMKKEDYGYQLSTWGQAPWVHEYSYKNSSKNVASIFNLSAGYTRNIGKTGMLRIEPYVKIPLKGIGIGSLPITSSGIYLGFTKNIY